jgi:hypothetical protein
VDEISDKRSQRNVAAASAILAGFFRESGDLVMLVRLPLKVKPKFDRSL